MVSLQNVGWVERSETQQIMILRRFGFAALNPTCSYSTNLGFLLACNALQHFKSLLAHIGR
jgi:hypothetical protein